MAKTADDRIEADARSCLGSGKSPGANTKCAVPFFDHDVRSEDDVVHQEQTAGTGCK